jgi:flagellar hook-associated protein 1 FlgK
LTRPTFLGFETGRKGLAVAQKGLDITGHNLMNVNTPGYTRQRVDQVSVSAYGKSSRYGGTKVDFAGQGVDITGIYQTRNAYLDRRFREEYSDTSYYDQKLSILGDISAVVDEMAETGGGLMKAVNTISSALQGLTTDKATDRSYANILRTAFQGMVQTLHEYDNKLTKVANQQKYDLTISIDEVNRKLKEVAGLNRQIMDEVAVDTSDKGFYGPNELLDSRNLLLDELAQFANLDVVEQEDGTVTVSMGGHVVVSGDESDKLQYMEFSDGGVSLAWNSSGKEVNFTTGSLQASIEMINGRGPNLQTKHDSPEKGVPYYKDQLDTFARTFANVMNNILPSKLTDQGEPDSIEYKQLVGAVITNEAGKQVVTTQPGHVTAGNITISEEWASELEYLFPSSSSATNSQYFTKMNTMLTTNTTTEFYTNGQKFSGSFRDFVTDIYDTCVGEESYYMGRKEASAAITDQLLDERDDVSAVSKDEETTNMMMYQRYFQAVSRMMTTMDEALDVVINKMGLVGRS